jgi:hypothetical protein
MKLVGMGLEEGTLGVRSYLDSIPAGSDPPEMSVLRWWFTLNYEAIKTTPDRLTFAIEGQGVKVLSENEMLTASGQRVHSGKSDELTAEFAASFTRHFGRLAAKYPVYADLKNIFDLALVAGLIRHEDLAGQVGWEMSYWADPQGYQVALGAAPREVQSIVNHRMLSNRRFVAGASGGVSVDTSKYVSHEAVKQDDYGELTAQYQGHQPRNLARNAWWWD